MKIRTSKIVTLGVYIGLIGAPITALASVSCPDLRQCCSPEVRQNSVAVMQKVMADAAADPEFSGAHTFAEFVRSTAAMGTTDQKINAYFSVVGIDSRIPEELVQFLGARNFATYIQAAEATLHLNQRQADLLVSRLRLALIGLMSRSN